MSRREIARAAQRRHAREHGTPEPKRGLDALSDASLRLSGKSAKLGCQLLILGTVGVGLLLFLVMLIAGAASSP